GRVLIYAVTYRAALDRGGRLGRLNRKTAATIVLLILALVLTTCSTNTTGASSEFWNVDEAPKADADAGQSHALEERDDAPLGSNSTNALYDLDIVAGIKECVSAVFYVPDVASTTPRDIALWNHPPTGLADYCAPSRRAVIDIRCPALRQLLDDGHIVVAS